MFDWRCKPQGRYGIITATSPSSERSPFDLTRVDYDMNWRRDRLIILGIIAAALAAYLPTLMTDISATDNSYFIDVGSNMNALAQWGTLHGSAYPLYSFTGAVFVAVMRLTGLSPAGAASLYSTLWGIATLIVLYIFLVEWRGDRVLALAAVGLLGFSWAYWLFSSYAEVYTLSAFVVVVALWCALKADRTRQVKYLYGLAVCCGLSISHARAIALALPAPLLIALPALWAAFWPHPLTPSPDNARSVSLQGAVRRGGMFAFRWIGLAALTGVVPYGYLLIRSLQHAEWIWGDPSTLDGFWRLMFGAAYTALLTWPTTLQGWLDLIAWVGQVWIDWLTWPIALLATAGLAWLFVRRQWRYALAFTLNLLILFVFAIAEQASFPGEPLDDIPAMLTPGFIFALSGLVFLFSDLRARSVWWWRGGIALSAVACAFMIVVNQPYVSQLTHDQTGRNIIRDAQRFVAASNFASPPAFFSPWSGEFWALSYGATVTGEIENFDLLPNRADLKEAVEHYGRVHTFEHTFYNRGLDWWRKRLGSVYLSSSGVKTIAVSDQPLITTGDLPRNNPTSSAMGEAPIELRDWQVTPLADGQWQITLYWQATASPDRDFSIFVQASDRDVIDSPAAIVAQADSRAPVHGWYPTTLWSAGEIVRDDHLIAPPPDRPAKIVVVGLYMQTGDGNFVNFGRQIIPLSAAP